MYNKVLNLLWYINNTKCIQRYVHIVCFEPLQIKKSLFNFASERAEFIADNQIGIKYQNNAPIAQKFASLTKPALSKAVSEFGE